MGEIKLIFAIKPVPKGRPRLSRYGGAYTPKETVEFENAIKALVKGQFRRHPIEGPLAVEVKLFFKAPKKASKPYPRGDLDNYVKAVLDALNGVVWVDDAQIIGIAAFKGYDERDHIELIVAPINLEARSHEEMKFDPPTTYRA